jgi:uncharacterized membrane protein YphA (DoxX/SURF4 family)
MTTTMLIDRIAEVKKALAALAGVVTLLLAQGVLSGTAARWAEVFLAVATVVGVHQVTNGRKAKPCAALTEEAAADDGTDTAE